MSCVVRKSTALTVVSEKGVLILTDILMLCIILMVLIFYAGKRWAKTLFAPLRFRDLMTCLSLACICLCLSVGRQAQVGMTDGS